MESKYGDYAFPGTHDILHDAGCERVFEEIYKILLKAEKNEQAVIACSF